MNKEEYVSTAIKSIISDMMDKVLDKVLVTEPFIKEKHHSAKPLYAALVPDEIFKGSHFERRFVTPFGSAWEKLAQAVAQAYHGSCQTGYTIEGTVNSESLQRIQETLNRLEHGGRAASRVHPNWEKELAYIREGKGEPQPVKVTCDVFIDSQATGKTYAFELKGPLPNSDQTKVSKEKMFKLLAMNEHKVDFAYYALPYNPYGKKEDYAWTFPKRWFNMREDPCVLIGSELWELLGDKGTYENFIREVNSLGIGYKERIYREFLGFDPPVGFDEQTLR